MHQPLTAGATRVLSLATRICHTANEPELRPVHLLWALLLDESRASELLLQGGWTAPLLRQRFPLPGVPDDLAAASETAEPPPTSALLDQVLLQAEEYAAVLGRDAEVTTEDLLRGLVEKDPSLSDLSKQGLRDALRGEVAAPAPVPDEPLPTDIQLLLPGPAQTDAADIHRVLDAAANRLREGLRVLEDFVRMTLDDPHLMRLLKDWRHRLAQLLGNLPARHLLEARDTRHDVGTKVHAPRELQRESLLEVVQANCKRVQEAARTLEEYSKVLSPLLGRQLGDLRYELYTFEKSLLTTHFARTRLQGRDVYVLVTEDLCARGSGPVIRGALAGGAGLVQIREKNWSDRKLLDHIRRARDWTAKSETLLIVNDRPDLAALADADGVHLGQDDLSVREARRILGPGKLVGVSTHTLEQARQAVLDGADYIGVGPVFSTTTKTFEQLAGLDLVREVSREITLPAYAIGGITLERLGDVLAAGGKRIAISSAICGDDQPDQATRRLVDRLRSEAPRPVADQTPGPNGGPSP